MAHAYNEFTAKAVEQTCTLVQARRAWLPISQPLKGEWLWQVGNDKVELKRIQLHIPAGHDLSGLTFVIRSRDSTAWWRDGARTPET